MTKAKPRTKPPKPPYLGVLPGWDLHAAMLKLHKRDGISLTEQARRALRTYLIAEGVLPKKEKRS